MVIAQIIEHLTEWIEQNICSEVSLLKPDDHQMGKGYTQEYVHPKAFPMFIPAKDCLPPEVETKLPAVCVQLLDGYDDLTKGESVMHIRLAFAAWRPGNYIKNRETDENGQERARQKFTMSADGWKDVWNFLDKTKRIIEKNMYIGEVRVDRKEPVKYGFFSEDETMVNAYPEWYAWLSFAIKSGTAASVKEQYRKLL